MFSSEFVCLFVSRIIRKNCSTDFHNIWWKGRAWATDVALAYMVTV